MTEPAAVSLVCCGLIGSAVADEGIMERAFAEAIATQGVVTGTEAYTRCMVQVHRARGRATVDIFASLFPDDRPRAQAAHLAFERAFRGAVDRFGLAPVSGADRALGQLAAGGVRVCLVTGLSRALLGVVLTAVGWRDRVDLALSADDVPRGCPWPDLALTAMLRLGVRDVRETAYADGTENGLLSGYHSGASIVAGLLTGAHAADRLRRAGATHLLDSVADLPDLVLPGGPAAGAEAPEAGPGGGVADPPDHAAMGGQPRPRVP